MKTIKQSLKMLKFNLTTVFLFELVYKLISVAIMTPVLYYLLNTAINMAEISFINDKTIGKFFRYPSTYLFLFIILVIFAMHMLINISALIYITEASYWGKKISVIRTLFRSLANSLRVLKPKNFLIVFYVLLVIPFTNSVMLSGSIAGLKYPEYVRDFLSRHKSFAFTVIAIYFIICVIAVFRIFALNYFTVSKMDFKQSVNEANKIVKKHSLKLFIGVIFINVIISLFMFGIEWIIVYGVAKYLKIITSIKSFDFIIHTVIQISFFGVYLFASLITTPLICSYICSCFYELEDDERHHDIDYVEERSSKRSVAWTVSVIAIAFALNIGYIYLSLNKRVGIDIWYPSNVTVTAHRGDSEHAPENTMEAIRLAVENQADIVEIDVRQTRDGVYIITHDESLKRTTGIDVKTGNVDYAFIKTLSVGADESREYAGEAIPTLAEVLEYANEEDVFLNIELKTAKTDREDYVEGVLQLIEEYEYADKCVVASSDYKVVSKVKEINSDIKTVYIVMMAIGDIGNFEDADVYSVRSNYIDASMVKSAHRNGKEIYAWTVDDEEQIKRLLLIGVDSIITNNPYNTKAIIYNANDSVVTDIFKRLIYEY
ncbi:MAG: glycerophosphodiester phosphodiesterase family protein [Wujia sp.]